MRAKRAVASISARVRKAHVPATRARMMASLPAAVTVGYLPLPAQQGSAPQPETVPAGNQQQQPLQFVHDAFTGFALQTALQDDASLPEPDFAASIVPEDPPESVGSFDPLLPVEEPVVPVPLLLPVLLPLLLPALLPLLLPVPLPMVLPLPLAALPLPLPLVLPVPLLPLLLPVDAPAASAPADPLEPDPLSSLVKGPAVPLVLLLQAASPTVDDAPMTTMTWKSFSIFMKLTLPPIRELGNLPDMSRLELESVIRGTPSTSRSAEL